MDATSTIDRPVNGSLDESADRLASTTSLRMDWVLAALSVWLIGGFYVDLWAHAHGEVDDTFLTPWHALLCAGALAFGIVLVAPR